jgi:hypothetical protein
MFVNEPLETFTDISSSSRRYTYLRTAVPSRDYPTKEAWREPLSEVYFNKVFINVRRVVNVKLS